MNLRKIAGETPKEYRVRLIEALERNGPQQDDIKVGIALIAAELSDIAYQLYKQNQGVPVRGTPNLGKVQGSYLQTSGGLELAGQ